MPRLASSAAARGRPSSPPLVAVRAAAAAAAADAAAVPELCERAEVGPAAAAQAQPRDWRRMSTRCWPPPPSPRCLPSLLLDTSRSDAPRGVMRLGPRDRLERDRRRVAHPGRGAESRGAPRARVRARRGRRCRRHRSAAQRHRSRARVFFASALHGSRHSSNVMLKSEHAGARSDDFAQLANELDLSAKPRPSRREEPKSGQLVRGFNLIT